MEFEGEFTVPGHAKDVMRRFADIERMARCMPGASLEGRDAEGNYIGVMTVAFGPKRVRFKGRMACEFDFDDSSGVLRGRGSADARAARVSFETKFIVKETETSDGGPQSLVCLASTAELGGVLADFAQTGGAALASVLMKEFAKNLSDELKKDGSGPLPELRPLSATKMAWGAVKSKLSR